MTRPLAVAVAIASLAAPSVAHAASLTPQPTKSCYRSGETVHFLGEGFTPGNPVSLSRDGTVFSSSIFADGNGKFDAELRLLQDQGRQVRTYTAANSGTQGPSASRQMTVSAVGVGLSPKNGPVSRRFRIKATGFTTGKVLWAHVVHKRSKRHLKIGRLRGACHDLRTRLRLLPTHARFGKHRIQFDTFRRYRADRPVKTTFRISVVRGDQ